MIAAILIAWLAAGFFAGTIIGRKLREHARRDGVDVLGGSHGSSTNG